MRKQVIAAATAIVLGIATTATGTIAFARGGGGFGGGGHVGGFGGGGHVGGFSGGGHVGGFGGGGHGFGHAGLGGLGVATGHAGLGGLGIATDHTGLRGHGVAMGHGGIDHHRFEARRFGGGLYAYGALTGSSWPGWRAPHSAIVSGARSSTQRSVDVLGWTIDADSMREIDRTVAQHVRTPLGPEFMAPTLRANSIAGSKGRYEAK